MAFRATTSFSISLDDYEVERPQLLFVPISDQINLVSSVSFAYKNAYDNNIDKINFSKIINNILKFEDLSYFEQLSPYRQLYLEINGWTRFKDWMTVLGQVAAFIVLIQNIAGGT